MRRSFFMAMATTFVVACDPQAAPAGKDAGAATKDDAATKRDASPTPGSGAAQDSPTPVFASLSACLESCERADVIPTNRETCKLNCDTAYGASAASPDPIGEAASCLGRCYAADGSPDACVSGCRAAAAGAQRPPAADVLDRLGTCVSTCHADKSVRPTNQATCELNCAQAARVAGTPPPDATAPVTR